MITPASHPFRSPEHLSKTGNSSIRIKGFFNQCSLFLILSLGLSLFVMLLPGCAPAGSASKKYSHPTQKPYKIKNRIYYPIPSSYGFTQKGIASWYGRDFHGKRTSNSEIYNMYDMTAAHKTLPMNTVVLVRNLENNREVVVRVNDRGPFVRGRIIDLSYSAARKLDIVGNGTAKVYLVALGDAQKNQEELKQFARSLYEGQFYIQIGSFQDRGNALRLQKRFTDAGHTTLIQKHYGNNAVYFRVHVYVGQTLKGALKERDILEARGYKDAFVIAR